MQLLQTTFSIIS